MIGWEAMPRCDCYDVIEAWVSDLINLTFGDEGHRTHHIHWASTHRHHCVEFTQLSIKINSNKIIAFISRVYLQTFRCFITSSVALSIINIFASGVNFFLESPRKLCWFLVFCYAPPRANWFGSVECSPVPPQNGISDKQGSSYQPRSPASYHFRNFRGYLSRQWSTVTMCAGMAGMAGYGWVYYSASNVFTA
jgi:hypothetical protein